MKFKVYDTKNKRYLTEEECKDLVFTIDGTIYRTYNGAKGYMLPHLELHAEEKCDDVISVRKVSFQFKL